MREILNEYEPTAEPSESLSVSIGGVAIEDITRIPFDREEADRVLEEEVQKAEATYKLTPGQLKSLRLRTK